MPRQEASALGSNFEILLKKKYWYWGKLDLEKPFPLTIPSPHFVCISSLFFLVKL
jgi:hypothetical protein